MEDRSLLSYPCLLPKHFSVEKVPQGPAEQGGGGSLREMDCHSHLFW